MINRFWIFSSCYVLMAEQLLEGHREGAGMILADLDQKNQVISYADHLVFKIAEGDPSQTDVTLRQAELHYHKEGTKGRLFGRCDQGLQLDLSLSGFIRHPASGEAMNYPAEKTQALSQSRFETAAVQGMAVCGEKEYYFAPAHSFALIEHEQKHIEKTREDRLICHTQLNGERKSLMIFVRRKANNASGFFCSGRKLYYLELKTEVDKKNDHIRFLAASGNARLCFTPCEGMEKRHGRKKQRQCEFGYLDGVIDNDDKTLFHHEAACLEIDI